MRVALNLGFAFGTLPLPERLAAAAANGFRAVELPDPYEFAPEALAGRLRAEGLALALINTPAGATRGRAALPGAERLFARDFERAVALARSTGCPLIHVLAGVPPPDAPPGEVNATLRHNLDHAATRAYANGLTLTLEPLNRVDVPGYAFHRPGEVTALLAELDHPALRWQFDLYHVLREGLDPLEVLRRGSRWLGHVQLGGLPDRREPDLCAAVLGDWAAELRARNYAGAVGLEFTPTRPLAGTLAALRALFVPATLD